MKKKIMWGCIALVILALGVLLILTLKGKDVSSTETNPPVKKDLKAEITVTEEMVSYWGPQDYLHPTYTELGTQVIGVGDSLVLDKDSDGYLTLIVTELTENSITFRDEEWLRGADHREEMKYSLNEEIKIEQVGVMDAGIFYILDVKIVD